MPLENYTLLRPDAAEKIAAILQESDPDWIYAAIHDPKGTGLSYILVYDENNLLVGKV